MYSGPLYASATLISAIVILLAWQTSVQVQTNRFLGSTPRYLITSTTSFFQFFTNLLSPQYISSFGIDPTNFLVVCISRNTGTFGGYTQSSVNMFFNFETIFVGDGVTPATLTFEVSGVLGKGFTLNGYPISLPIMCRDQAASVALTCFLTGVAGFQNRATLSLIPPLGAPTATAYGTAVFTYTTEWST